MKKIGPLLFGVILVMIGTLSSTPMITMIGNVVMGISVVVYAMETYNEKKDD